jgi:hypothetical protein
LLQNETVNFSNKDFEVKTTVMYIDDPYDGQVPTDPIGADYKQVKVEVSWGGAFPSFHPVTYVSNFVPNGIESNAGGGTLFTNVINASGLPVTNAQVHITNSTAIPPIDVNVTTDSFGRVMLPGAPSCNSCYHISVSKSGFTTDRTYSYSEVTNPLKPDASVLEGQLTSITLTIDQTSQINVQTTGRREINYPPFSGVQFHIRGTKIIGTNASDQPVYKHDQSYSSGIGGLLTISDLDWDNYEVTIPNPSSVDLAGTSPLSPFVLLPGQTLTLTIVTTPASTNNLLTAVQTITNSPIATATATLKGPLGFIATQSAGPTGKGDVGQTLFSGLSAGTYFLDVSQIGYHSNSSIATVSGDIKATIYLTP